MSYENIDIVKHERVESLAISRRGLIAATGLAAFTFSFGAAGNLCLPSVASAEFGKFDTFKPDNPWAKPTDLLVPMVSWSKCKAPDAWGHSANRANHTTYSPTYNDTWGNGDMTPWFLNYGTPLTILPMDDKSWSGWVSFPEVGTYKGSPVGCKLTISNPTISSGLSYNQFNEWQTNQVRKTFSRLLGTSAFFVVSDGFATWDACHWLTGLSSVHMKFEFFNSSDTSRTPINLDWCYLAARSIQHDCGGDEWVGPAENHQGHYFVPDGVNTQLNFSSHDGHQCIQSYINEISDRTCAIMDFSGTSVNCWRGDTVGRDGFQFDFLSIAEFHRFNLIKTSALPCVTADSDRYSLAGAEYGVWSDKALTRKCGSFTTGEDGRASISAVNGTDRLMAGHTYWIKETKAPWGYLLNKDVYKVTLESDATLEVQDVPEHAEIKYHCDGIDDESVVFSDYIDEGSYTVNSKATEIAIKPFCNLNQDFGTEDGTGFSGWFLDPELIKPYSDTRFHRGDILHLYGRNRCTVRIEYAEGSLRPEEGIAYRRAASDGAAEVIDALSLMDFSRGVEAHVMDGLSLPAIGDDGAGHKAVYWGERVAPVKPSGVYAKQQDGTWRRYVAECWLTSAGGGFLDSVYQGETGHNSLCQVVRGAIRWRHERKEVNIIRDGGAASVPSPRASLTGGARR